MASTPLVMTDFTNNVTTDSNFVVTGTGIFDDMMEGVTAHIKAQYDSGTINGTDYANVYLGALQFVIQSSTKIFLDKGLVAEQVATETAKTALVANQSSGFKVDAQHKLLKLMLENYTLALTSNANFTGATNAIEVGHINTELTNLTTDIGLMTN